MPLHYDTYKQVVSALDRMVSFFTESHTALNHLPEWVWYSDKTGFDFEEVKQLLDEAKGEIREAEDTARKLSCISRDPFLDEDEILMTCALRFDGYKYKQLTDFDQKGALEDFFATGEWTISPLEQLATFFLLQRGLFKWGLEWEPKDGKYWRAFRSLFLLVHHYEVPEALRDTVNDSYYRWEYKYKPRLLECVEFIRGIHKNTRYEDETLP